MASEPQSRQELNPLLFRHIDLDLLDAVAQRAKLYMDNLKEQVERLGRLPNPLTTPLPETEVDELAFDIFEKHVSPLIAAHTHVHISSHNLSANLPLEILQSESGFYLGTRHPLNGSPYTRESSEYWPQRSDAVLALITGTWTQQPHR